MGDPLYDEKRKLQRENELLRERKENDRLKKELRFEERMEVISQGLAAFFAGKACIRQGQTKWFFDRLDQN